MIENSSAGLTMLDAEVAVTVTGEERHQSWLARYPVLMGGERRVAVELGWCVIASGKYRGHPAIEVRLDGHRVGELTYAMSQRYAPLVSRVTAHRGRPGCAAVIQHGARGLEVTLRLPRHTSTHPASAPLGPPRTSPHHPSSGVPGARPTGRPADPRFHGGPHLAPVPPAPHLPGGPHLVPSPPAPQRPVASHRPWWIAAAVVAVLFIAAVATNDDEPTNTAADLTTTTTAVLTTTTTATTTTAAPATTTLAPVPQPVQSAPPPPVTAQPAPPPAPPKPQPKAQCDPNYTGCVPIASDVDCAGGSGNGPAYVRGPVQVIGTDIYRLDSDNDGTACE